METENKQGTISDELKAIKELIRNPDSKKEEKKKWEFKIPFRGKVGKAKVKKNYVTIMKINENKAISFSREQIQDQTIMIDEVPRLSTGEDVLSYKNKPLIIIPSWSVAPFSPTNEYKESLENGSNTAGYRLLLARMKMGILETKKKMGMGMLIGGLVIAGIIAYAYFSNGGSFTK